MKAPKKGSEDFALKVLASFLALGFALAFVLAIIFIFFFSPFLLILLIFQSFRKIKRKIYGKVVALKVKEEIIYPFYLNQINSDLNNVMRDCFFFTLKKYYLRVKDPTGWYTVVVSKEFFEALKETRWKYVELEIEKDLFDREYNISLAVE